MNTLITTVLTLSIFSQLCAMDPKDQMVPLASSPSSKGVFNTLNRWVTNATDNILGHGDGYIKELEGKQESFRAHDMRLNDLLELTHRGEWGMLEFLKEKKKAELKQCLELTEKHVVPLNPAVVKAAKQLLDLDCPGPVFIKLFKDKKLIDADPVESSEETLQTIHLAENAITQFIQASSPEQLNEVLQLVQKHSIRINPVISSNALKFLHIYQTECQETILKLIANIKQAESFKNSVNKGIKLSESTILFDFGTFKKTLSQTLDQK